MSERKVSLTGIKPTGRPHIGNWLGMYRPALELPTRDDIDWPLIIGAALFGAGWGLAGYCPGPGLAAIVQLTADPLWFVLGLVAGMVAYAQAVSRS